MNLLFCNMRANNAKLNRYCSQISFVTSSEDNFSWTLFCFSSSVFFCFRPSLFPFLTLNEGKNSLKKQLPATKDIFAENSIQQKVKWDEEKAKKFIENSTNFTFSFVFFVRDWMRLCVCITNAIVKKWSKHFVNAHNKSVNNRKTIWMVDLKCGRSKPRARKKKSNI